jgi:hypothetical protein
MAKLTGTNPDQVPTNADLGTMAYQDKDNVNISGGEVTGDITVVDNKRIYFGTDNDMNINHGGANGSINNSTGNLSYNSDQHIFGDEFGTERMRIDSAGDVDIANELIAGSYNETYSALSGTSPTVNCETGNAFSLTLSGNTTFTFSNPPASGTAYSFSIEIIQDASASGYTVTWPSSVDWPAATAPTLTATASAKDVFVFTTRDGGSNWYGFTAGQALG